MSKLNKFLFGRRTWAIIVAIVMVLQLLPIATIADTTKGDESASFVPGRREGGDGDWTPGGKGGEEDFNPGALIGDLPGETEQPTEPENPEEPVEPENPETPVEPEEPGEPADPEIIPDEQVDGIDVYFPVVFTDKDGNVLARKSVLAGTAIGELPEAPAVEGRAFIGWFNEDCTHVYTTTIVNGFMKIAPKYEGDEIPQVVMPAQSFSGTADNGVTVNATAPAGVFPAGTKMVLTAVSDERAMELARQASNTGRIVVDAVAVDISFYDVNGKKIEPKNENKVRVSINTGRVLQGEYFSIYHENANGTMSLMGTATPNGGSFDSASFSVYIVDGEEEDARLIVKLYQIGSDGQNVSTPVEILVKKNDIGDKFNVVVYDPGPGTLPDGYLFGGWTTDSNWDVNTTTMSFEDVREAIKDYLNNNTIIDNETTISFYATAFQSKTVTYKDQNGATIKTDVVRLVNGSSSYPISQSYTPFETTQNFAGWTTSVPSTTDGKTYTYDPAVTSANLWQSGADITVTDNMVLYPYIQTGYWLIFDNNIEQDDDPTKGVYIGPIFYASGVIPQESDISPTPHREGYTLVGWYLDEEMTTPYTFSSALTEDTTIYAKWAPAATEYMVVYMTQNATDALDDDVTNNTYEFYDSVSRTWYWNGSARVNATTGTTVSAYTQGNSNNDSSLASGGIAQSTYYPHAIASLGVYFTYSAKNTGVSAVVNGDGSTILYVYYDRVAITFNFITNANMSYKTISGYELAYNSSNNYYYIKLNGSWRRITAEGRYVWGASAITAINTGNRRITYTYNGYSYSDAYYANNTSTISEPVSITGLYGAPIPDGAWPSPGSGNQWKVEESSYFYDEDNYLTSFVIPAGANTNATTVNFYLEEATHSSDTITIHCIYRN